MDSVNLRKVAIIGCGFVGSSSAFALMQSGLFSEMILIDADTSKAEGEAIDISHGLPFAKCSNLMLLSLSSTRHCRTPYCPRKQGRFVITAYIIMSLSEKGQVQTHRI